MRRSFEALFVNEHQDHLSSDKTMLTPEPMPCFCGSKRSFSDCCEPILKDHSRALTPLALMRSRYSAYVLGREGYLLATWDPSTRPGSLSLMEDKVKWLELIIHAADGEQPQAVTGEVDFSARFIDRDQFCELRENSRFVRTEGLWYYLDGACEIARTKLNRNGACPCGSGKKFKRCCLAG